MRRNWGFEAFNLTWLHLPHWEILCKSEFKEVAVMKRDVDQVREVVMSTLDGIILSHVSIICSFSRIGYGLCFHDCSVTGMLKCLQMCQWNTLQTPSCLSVHRFSTMSFFTPQKEVTGTFCFFPTKTCICLIGSIRYFLKSMSVMSLGIDDDSFSSQLIWPLLSHSNETSLSIPVRVSSFVFVGCFVF